MANDFEAIVKRFMRDHGILTRSDLVKIETRIDRLEKLIKTTVGKGPGRPAKKGTKGRPAVNATETVLEAISRIQDGAKVKAIAKETGFDEKKIQNIVFRLNKLGKIKRIERGVFVLADQGSEAGDSDADASQERTPE